MAKCPICNSRKGKRKCLNADGLICSQCCGHTRTEDACQECTYYQKPKRNYSNVPAYSVSEMDGNESLESYGNTIEGALCEYDLKCDLKLKDWDAIRIIELLIDKYHFQDQKVDHENELIVNGFKHVDKAITEDLNHVRNDIFVKVLGVIRFVAKRRTQIGREYMCIIHRYVGMRNTPGLRILEP